jgi:hypothetical protein
MTTSGLTIA